MRKLQKRYRKAGKLLACVLGETETRHGVFKLRKLALWLVAEYEMRVPDK